MKLVHQYNGTTEPAPVTITYNDEDGDTITVSSTEELAEAFAQFADKSPPVVHAFAKFDCEKVDSQVNTDSLKKRVQLLEQQVNAMSKQIRTLTIDSEGGSEEQMTPTQPAVTETAPKEETEVKATPKPTATEPAPSVDVPKELNLECFDPNFIHGRHTCDGCFTTPILGHRFTATNLPDYDLCHKCFKKYKGADILFQPEQLDRDTHLQRRWQDRRLKRVNGHRRQHMKEQHGQCLRELVKNTATQHVDEALNEAIRLSLIEESKKTSAAATESKNEVDSTSSNVTPKQVGTQTDAPKKEANDDSHSTDTPKAVSSAPEENMINEDIEVTVPPLKVVCPQVPVFELEINKPQLEQSSLPSTDEENLSQPGEKIIDGDEDDASEAKSDGSSSNWQVVDEDGLLSDEMVAQATQMLGSALFQSDMASTDVHMTTDSVSSGLTSVPTITSKSEISAVLLQRWEKELRQLHEFGFLDDHANVDALGHLEAANMGVDSDDPIKINTVVDHLLKQKKEFDA